MIIENFTLVKRRLTEFKLNFSLIFEHQNVLKSPQMPHRGEPEIAIAFFKMRSTLLSSNVSRETLPVKNGSKNLNAALMDQIVHGCGHFIFIL